MKKACSLSVAIAALSAITTQTSYANKLEEMVVISSRTEMPIRQIGTSVSVLTEEDIAKQGAFTLADALRNLPAVGVTNSGGVGKASTVRIRGEEGYRTLVLIDGVNVSDPTGTQIGPQFAHIMASNISRVEVLRGAQGMMYGADAGGVINIITRAPQNELQGDISLKAGSFNTREVAGNILGGNDTVDFSLSIADYATNGFNTHTSDTDLQDDDGYDNTTLHGRVGFNLQENLRLEAVARDVSAENEYDRCFGSSGYVNDCTNENDQTTGKLSLDYDGERFDHELSYEYSDVARAFFTEGSESFGTEGEITRLAYLGSSEINKSSALVYGIEQKNEKITSSSDIDRDQTGIFLEYQFNLNDSFFITAGGRHDKNDDFGRHNSYRITTAYLHDLDNGNSLKFKSSYGTGFRAPSLSEIAYNERPTVFPPAADVELKEEYSRGLDAGVEYFTKGGVHVEAVYFSQKIEDEIYFDLDSYSGYLQAEGESKSSGVEVSAIVPVTESIELRTAYTYNDTEQSNGDTRSRRPKHLANIGLSYIGLEDKLRVSTYWRTARNSFDISSNSDLDDYDIIDLSASYKLSDALDISVQIKNISDQDYKEVPGYNTAGSAGYVGVKYSF